MASSHKTFVGNHSMSIDYMLSVAQDLPNPVDDLKVLAVHLRAARAVGMPVVYAALRSEQPVVKIGMSRRLAGRGGRLSHMPGCSLVAVLAGDRQTESEVHARLAASRTRAELPGQGVTEHFHLTDEVMAWVNETRESMSLIPVTLGQMLSFSAQAA